METIVVFNIKKTEALGTCKSLDEQIDAMLPKLKEGWPRKASPKSPI